MYLVENAQGKAYNYTNKRPLTPILRRFTLSCEIFSGFTQELDVSKINTIQEVIDHVLFRLIDVLRENHLEDLVTKLHHMWNTYHIHDYDIYNILIEEREYYICNHGC